VGSSKVPQLFERIERDGVAGGLLLSQKGLLNGRKMGLRALGGGGGGGSRKCMVGTLVFAPRTWKSHFPPKKKKKTKKKKKKKGTPT
jgi:hypothetical protein